jgi:polyisoprenoid-binding protein YceI
MTRVSAAILFLVLACLARAADRPIDVEKSKLTIHVGKAGLFSVAGHEHQISAPIAEGVVNEAEPAHISFRIDAPKLALMKEINESEANQAQIQQTMQTKVLESERYPAIEFHSTSVAKSADNAWQVKGELTLHGQTHAVNATVRRQAEAYVGRCQIKQTDFGITPVTAGGGTVKVKNELEIEFSVVPAATAP